MTTKFISAAVVLTFIFISSFAQSEKHSFGHIGLVYPLSTNGVNAAEFTNPFSLHAIAGLSGSEEAFCASGVTNVIMNNAEGAVLAGFSNHIGGSASGAVFAGFMNTVGNDAEGIMGAGFLNVSGSMSGAQLAGFSNVAKDVDGIQMAGFINKAENANTQLAGFINVAKDVDGAQVAGFINVARKVSGPQVAGFINIAEHSDYPIGIVNIIKDGDKGIGFTIDETQTTLLSLRSGGRALYGILGIGINFKQFDPLYGLEAGIGAHLIKAGAFRLNIEGSVLSLTDFYDNTYLRSSIRLLPALRIADRVEIFAGPSFNHIVFDQYFTREIIGHYLWEDSHWGYVNGLYIGGIAGVQLMF